MGWMSRVLGKDEAKQKMVVEKQQPASAGIAYHPELIRDYLANHREIETLFAAIGEMAKTNDHLAIPHALAQFKTALESHLLSENVRFYSYMQQETQSNPQHAERVKGFRTDMNDIARHVVHFIRKWKDAGVTSASAAEFLTEHQAIGALLARRIQSEEKDLYPLYQPPRQAH